MAAAPTVFLGRCPSRTAKAVGQWRPASEGEHSVIIRAAKLLGIGAGFSAANHADRQYIPRVSTAAAMTFHRQAFREGSTRRARAVHTAVVGALVSAASTRSPAPIERLARNSSRAAMMLRRHTIATSVGGALRRPDTVRLSVNNARNRSVPAIYHAVFASVSSAKHRKDHLIHYRSQKTHRK